jgi:hypothetical protein
MLENVSILCQYKQRRSSRFIAREASVSNPSNSQKNMLALSIMKIRITGFSKTLPIRESWEIASPCPIKNGSDVMKAAA